jgi:hypothetical protein
VSDSRGMQQRLDEALSRLREPQQPLFRTREPVRVGKPPRESARPLRRVLPPRP